MRLRRSGKVEKMLLNARGIEAFNLDNNFIPDIIAPENIATCVQVMRDTFRCTKHSYVATLPNGRYCLKINSNNWYEFSVANMK